MSKIEAITASEIGIISSRNISRLVSDENINALAISMAEGWDVGRGVIGVTPMTPVEVERAVKERETAYANLQGLEKEVQFNDKKLNIDLKKMQESFKNLYTGTPVYRVVFGYRRMMAITMSNAINPTIGLDVIPVKILTGTQQELNLACVKENTLKNTGTKTLTTLDKVVASRRLYEGGCREAALGKVFARGTAQKLFSLCKLDGLFPELKIIDRILSGQLNLGIFDKEGVRKLLQTSPSEKDIVEWIANPKKINSTKVAKGADIHALVEQSPVLLVKEIVGAVADNNLDSLLSMVDNKEDLNALWQAFKSGAKIIIVGKDITKKEWESVLKERKPKIKKAKKA